jgi:hypothetical protein
MHDRHHSVRRSSVRARLEAGTAAAVLTAVMCVPLLACAGGNGAAKNSSTHVPMTTAPMKANGSGIAVSYRIEATPQAGGHTTVTLSFDGVTDPAGATIRLSVDGGLSLGSAAALPTLPANAPTTLSIDVVPAAAGIGYLNVFTTQHGVTGATSIPVQVDKTPSKLPSTGELKQTPAGDKILSMPVK